jgi:ribose 5-phosphate isomerase B
MKIAIGSDHAGYLYKEEIKRSLAARGHAVTDVGTHGEESVDYPDFCFPVAAAVARGEADRGIVLGGSGNGEAMAANRYRAVRCALCWNAETARLSRRHNDANMLSLGERMIPLETALEIVAIWLETPFDGGRHEPRIAKLATAGEAV